MNIGKGSARAVRDRGCGVRAWGRAGRRALPGVWRLAALAALLAGTAAWAENLLSMRQAIELARKNRPEMPAARSRTQSAMEMKRQAGVLMNPKLVYQSENLRTGPNFSFADQTDTYLYLSQPLEISGKRGGRISVAAEQVERSRIEEQIEERNILYGVKVAFWQALTALQVRDLLAEDIQYFQQVLNYHEARLREGKIAEVDVLRVRLEGERLFSAKVNADLEYDRARLQLAREIGVPEAANWTPADVFDLTGETEGAASAGAQAAKRPETRLAEKDVDLARAQLKLQRANGRPDLDVVAGYKRWDGLNTAVAGLQINVPIFDRNRGGTAAAESDVQAAAARLKASSILTEAELRIAQRQYEARKDQVIHRYRPLRDMAQEISRISRAAYEEGGTDLLRLLDAERLRTESQLAYVQSLRDYHLSVTELERAKGVEP